MHFDTWYTFSLQKWITALFFFDANEIGSVHVYGKKTHDRNGLSSSHLHHNGRRGADHVYFVMPNQQYSQLQNMYL